MVQRSSLTHRYGPNVSEEWNCRAPKENVVQPEEQERTSEYNDSDELRSLTSGSEDDVDKGTRSFVQFNPEVDMKKPNFRVGQLFGNASVLKQAIREHAIPTIRNIKLYTNEEERVRAKCYRSPQCDWVLYASKLAEKDSLIVKHII
ncbi:hypothetical protein RJ640_006989 [Escallonia rubra]|uniref:Transposase MuDR plant domain-containing protein n=1 Tax=Escallonia rubra TaxID=112253 RepID=A0AA88R2N8_9ASTE|nr:hypothetical protein RJ640_006989 [Escallonia rubra]